MSKLKKYRKPLNINLGMIIFSVIFIYLVICVIMYFRSSHVVGYEVQTGSLSVNNIYKALAIRDEETFKATHSGYISYYAREGTRVAVGDLVYAIDETGHFTDTSANGGDEAALSDTDLNDVKGQIAGFSGNFKPSQFFSVYDFKYSLEGMMMQLGSYKGVSDASDLGEGLVDVVRASKTGIVLYSTDGFEDLKPEKVTMESFDRDNYERNVFLNNNLVNTGDPVYKISLSEDWSLMIPVDEAKAAELEEAEYVRVKFLRSQNSSWGKVTIHRNEDGIYAELGLNNSMITFCTDRYVDIELVTQEESGLKIPNSSIAQKEFFLVPVNYVVKGGSGGKDGVYVRRFSEDGKESREFVETPIYSENDNDYFLDSTMLNIGDYIIEPETGEQYAISRQNTLIGVYNINKGYADFKEIEILYQNDEYSVVKSGTMYGLSVYDYIALDARSVEENKIINE